MSTLAPNTLIHSRYRIVQLMGQGGMGAVYEAIDTRLSSRVALKQLIVAGAQLEKAFENEAKLLANMRHPALPRVIDYFSDAAGQFLVMDFVAGNDLDAMLARRNKPFSVDETLRIGIQLLGALSYLHGQSPPILHRDVKPSNIKLNTQGEVMLLDFGLAKGSAAYTAHILSVSSLLGYTPHYAPLEQIQGSGTDIRSDLYAAAATLYHLLTGSAPADALTRASEVLRGQPDPLQPASERNPAVPQALSSTLQQALSLNPSQRPASAAEMQRLLSAPPPSAAPPPAAPAASVPTQLATPPAPTLAANQVAPTLPQLAPTPAVPASGLRWLLIIGAILVVLLELVSLLQPKRFSSTPPPALATMHTPVTAIAQPTAAPALTVAPSLPTAAPAPTVASLPALEGKIAFSSGRDGNDEIYVMNVDGSQQTRLTNNTAIDDRPTLSPDGRQIAFYSFRDGNGEIYVMNADGSNQIRLTNGPAQNSAPAWSPDGRQIVFSSVRDGDWEIYVMNADGSNQVRLTNNSADDLDPAWSPDGHQIAFHSFRDGRGNGEIYVMNVDGSKQTRLTNNRAQDYSPAWSPDGRQIAFYSFRDGYYAIYVMNADGSKQTRLTNYPDQCYSPAWSPDGHQLSFAAASGGETDIYVMNADGSQQTRLTKNPAEDRSPAWSPMR